MKRIIKAAYGSSNPITVGDIYEVSRMFGTKVFIYDVKSGQPITDDSVYFKDAMREFPELETAQVVELSARGSQKFSIGINATFDFEPAW